ncbi:uncharacterized protein LOC142228652 [Haematobia irritans]|uniref:uncharacterized protein LOC142228652 n=1 Tax=Haematobia irritans TaxID=7368 RepID=UPI003F501BDD
MSNFSFDLDDATDEDFFGTLKSPSSKLQQLFAKDGEMDDKEQSLKYQRPKANNDSFKSEAIAASTNSHQPTPPLIAKVVTAYLQGKIQGKVGLALTSNVVDNLILYKSKSLVLVTLILYKEKQVLFKQSNYWQFYDDQQRYWSFSFENSKDEEDFRNYIHQLGHCYKENEENFNQKLEKENVDESITKSGSVEESELDVFQGPFNDNPTVTKNALIKRMAKMGQPLPKLSNSSVQTTTEFSDSSDTEVINTPLPIKPTVVPRNKVTTLKTSHQVSNAFNMSYAPSHTAMEGQYMQMLLTEQRTQGSELRMNVAKLENKIERLMDKLDLMERSGLGGGTKEKRHKDDEILELEEKILNLKKENRKLKQQEEERIQKQAAEEESNAILKDLKEGLEAWNMDHLKDMRAIVKSGIELVETHKNKELEGKWKECETTLKSTVEQVETSPSPNYQQELNQLKEQNKLLKETMEEKDKMLEDYKGTIENLKKDIENKTNDLTPNAPDAIVKTIMNNLYGDIFDRLETANFDNRHEILSIVATSIKEQTLKSLTKSHKDETGSK